MPAATHPWIALVSSGASRHTERLLAAARGRARMEVVDAGELGVDLQRERIRIRRRGVALPPFEAALFRRVNPRIPFDYQIQVLREWQTLLCVVINRVEPMLLALDKLAVAARLRCARVPTPATWVVADLQSAEEIVRREGMVVAKPLYGSMGEGVELWKDSPGIRPVIADFLVEYGAVLLQEFVPGGGRDVRAFVVGDRTVAGCTRMAVEGEWRTNLAQGGIPDPVELTAEMENLAVSAVRAVGLDYSGVDLIRGANGWKVLEVNGAPSFLGLEKATGFDVAGHLVDFLLERLDRQRRTAA